MSRTFLKTHLSAVDPLKRPRSDCFFNSHASVIRVDPDEILCIIIKFLMPFSMPFSFYADKQTMFLFFV